MEGTSLPAMLYTRHELSFTRHLILQEVSVYMLLLVSLERLKEKGLQRPSREPCAYVSLQFGDP